jgi:hypothetical protein
MQGIASSNNYFGLPGNKWGLIDKQDQNVGMSEVNIEQTNPFMVIRDNFFNFDTRDCVGELSLAQAQLAFAIDVASRGKIPIDKFKETFSSNNVVSKSKLVDIVDSLNITGFPRIKDETPYIRGNIITFRFQKILKLVKNLEIINVNIPRDIIPIYVYFPGFVNNCLPISLPGVGLSYLTPNSGNASSTWESPIPETANDFFDPRFKGISSNRLSGVYQTPLRYWRSYTGQNCMPNPHTPPPYQLWNPPQDFNSDDPWPFQPVPVRGQRIPTYVSKNGVVFSGYGLYDLEDFPESQDLQLANGKTIQIPIRKIILKQIVPKGQFINNVSAEDLIDISTTNDFNEEGIVNNALTQTGYGDYQRFIPGPGVGMNYQPNQWRALKSAPIDLSCSTFDPDTGVIGPMPVPFPNFRGNVWGPYGRPGDRFQNKSLQLTIDELYLNGDLENLEGNPIIWQGYDPTKEPYNFEYYISTIKRQSSIIRFINFETASNPNIRNAMRVDYDGGFGAVAVEVGSNSSSRGSPGPIVVRGLPNTQYDGNFHKFNPEVWVTPKEEVPRNWLETLAGPQRPTIVSSDTFPGWLYIWRDIFPWTGQVYVPVTAGGTGPMEYYDCDSVSPEWKKSKATSELTTGSSQWSCSPVLGQSNNYYVPSTNGLEYVSNLTFGQVTAVSITDPGTDFTEATNVLATGGTGTLFSVDITSVSILGEILAVIINNPGSGYITGQILVVQQGSNVSGTLLIDAATTIPNNYIPENNIYHYIDPLAVGPGVFGTTAVVNQNYANGVDVCTTDCPDNCTFPVGQKEFCVGEKIADASTACNDPRPIPDPPCLLKCDFVSQEGPETEWEDEILTGSVNQRPNDNVRLRQLNDYVCKRVSYNDLGPNNGFLISSLINYRSFFVSSTKDTDVVIKVVQAERNVFTQSLNVTVDQSNFYTPIRLNLGTTSGTLEYVEAVQGTLASAGVYWKKEFYPPLAKLGELQLELYAYDGTPIPIERSLGFSDQITNIVNIFSADIITSFILHGNFIDPYIPSFSSTTVFSLTNVLRGDTNDEKTLQDPFNPTLERYTQRNLGIIFRMLTYQAANPGITNIIKEMPESFNNVETFVDADGDEQMLIPLAGNIDDYGR